MEIREEDFILTPINDSTPKYDLELLYKIKAKGKEPRMEFKVVAYGIGLEYALKKIVQYRISQKHQDAAITMKEYLDEFRSELDKLKKLCEL